MPVFFWLFGIVVSPAARDWADPTLATGALASGAFFVSKRLTLARSGAARSRCRRYDPHMATGWAGDTAVQDQIDATVEDAIKRARSRLDRKSTRLNSSHVKISYAVFCLKKKSNLNIQSFCENKY